MERILAGAAKFLHDEYPKNKDFFEKMASKKQKPRALFITCSDSRVNPNLITQTEPGDLFLLRNAGNIVPPYGSVIGGEAATIEYAVEVLEIPNIIICGHSQCGAMSALISRQGIDALPSVKAWCEHAEATRRIMQQKYPGLTGDELALVAAEQNVLVQLNNLSTHPCIAARLSTGKIRTYGWYFDIGTGSISQYDPVTTDFEKLGDEALSANPLPLLSMRGTA